MNCTEYYQTIYKGMKAMRFFCRVSAKLMIYIAATTVMNLCRDRFISVALICAPLHRQYLLIPCHLVVHS